MIRNKMLDGLEKQIRQLQRTVSKYGKYIEQIEKDLALLKKDSHPPIERLEDRLIHLEKKGE
jgi:hypothetical protein|tara:strand:- start:4494 stop:4679 length:186 start_codon:yes stop_codon:yes gene_type:complete